MAAESLAPAISVTAVSKTFTGGVHALDGVSLDVAPGEFVAVLGASGCGKSTLLRLVAGLDYPTSGQISVLGKTPDTARRKRDFGIVFQDPALFPWRTVRKNISLPGEILRSPEVLARVPDWIGRVGLAGFENALPAQLSGGMRSRVAIARALVFNPRVLMMDEPFGALDELTRMEMHRELLSLYDQSRPTVLFITHGLEEALFLSDRVVVMSARPGRVRSVVSVPFPRPREPRIRNSAEFGMLTTELLDLLTAKA